MRGMKCVVEKDAFTIVGILEIHNTVMDTFLKENPAIDRAGFAAFLGVVTVPTPGNLEQNRTICP